MEAVKNRGVLNLTFPLESGIVNDWDGMVELWKHVYDNELKINSEEHPVMLTEAPMNPDECRKTMCVKFFEELKVPAYYSMV